MGFTKHLTPSMLVAPSLAPCSHMVGIHFRKFVNTGLVGIIPLTHRAAIGNSLFLSRFGLTLVSSPLG